jgi:2-methylcitrate dehydratase
MLQDIADYVRREDLDAAPAREHALHELTNALADGFSALHEPGIAALLGPGGPGATLAHGARVPGTSLELNPPMAAFNIAAMWTCVDLAAILAVADYLARRAHNDGRPPLRVCDVLTALIKARALRGMLAEGPKPASATLTATTAVLAQLLGGQAPQIAAAVEAAWTEDAPRGPAVGLAGSRRAAAAAGCAVRWAWIAVHSAGPVSPRTLVPPPRGAEAPRERDACDFAAAGFGKDTVPKKFAASVAAHFAPAQAALIIGRFAARATLQATPVNEFMASLVKNG